MSRDAFIRLLRRDARRNGLEFRLSEQAGKGSHTVVMVGEKKTTLPIGDYTKGNPRTYICRQFGIDPAAL